MQTKFYHKSATSMLLAITILLGAVNSCHAACAATEPNLDQVDEVRCQLSKKEVQKYKTEIIQMLPSKMYFKDLGKRLRLNADGTVRSSPYQSEQSKRKKEDFVEDIVQMIQFYEVTESLDQVKECVMSYMTVMSKRRKRKHNYSRLRRLLEKIVFEALYRKVISGLDERFKHERLKRKHSKYRGLFQDAVMVFNQASDANRLRITEILRRRGWRSKRIDFEKSGFSTMVKFLSSNQRNYDAFYYALAILNTYVHGKKADYAGAISNIPALEEGNFRQFSQSFYKKICEDLHDSTTTKVKLPRIERPQQRLAARLSAKTACAAEAARRL